jgi:hypothetical protein
VPADDLGRDDDARVRERENRQHEIARPRRHVAQQSIRGRLEAVVDRIELLQRGRRRPVPELLAAVARFRGQDRVGLRDERAEIGRRPRRDECREQHARERRMQSARMHAGPQDHADQDVRRHAIHPRAIQQRERARRGHRA